MPDSRIGYREIAAYVTGFGPVTAVGVEGTGSYGAELARVLSGHGFTVREVSRPNRAERRLRGKADALDAYQAAESVLGYPYVFLGATYCKARVGHRVVPRRSSSPSVLPPTGATRSSDSTSGTARTRFSGRRSCGP